ncbi:MAG TPA: hypothetical protein VHT52_13040 [Stellaceae bacterium]|nr:hypothetical protein [Stellaceae bacterium]
MKGNTVIGFALGIDAGGVVTGNYATGNVFGMNIGPGPGTGNTVIGNTASFNEHFGMQVSCPSNVTDNTVVGNNIGNLALGEGCNNTNNVAP